jgi:hypothetical protein
MEITAAMTLIIMFFLVNYEDLMRTAAIRLAQLRSRSVAIAAVRRCL